MAEKMITLFASLFLLAMATLAVTAVYAMIDTRARSTVGECDVIVKFPESNLFKVEADSVYFRHGKAFIKDREGEWAVDESMVRVVPRGKLTIREEPSVPTLPVRPRQPPVPDPDQP